MAKVVSVGSGLITVPLTIGYLGPELYGMWATIVSFIAILSFADLGLGNGVLSGVADAAGRDDLATARRYVSSGYLALTLIAGVFAVVFAITFPLVEWSSFFNVKTPLAMSEAAPAVAVFAACFICGIPLAVVQRVQLGMQRGFLAAAWQCVSGLLTLVGLLAAVFLEAPLPWLILVFAGVPVLVNALNSFTFYRNIGRAVAPSVRLASWIAGRRIARIGSLFFVLQVVVAVAYASDTFLVAHLVDASSVASYNVPERMFGMVSIVIGMALTPLWPAYGEAIARGDHGWVRQTLRRSLITAVPIAAAATIAIAIVGPYLLSLWVGDKIMIVPGLLWGFALWKTVETAANTFGAFLNGSNVIMQQVVISILTAIAALSLKLYLVPLYGVAIVPWSTAAAFLAFTILPYTIWLTRRGLLF
ncbi:hypothetical protein NKJ51_12310 [Mesorhizobium sp. M0134]|uniref:lipopolysaccharide biosynthesis protein n=1 Tax=Mesorhizobium sp. M0134 TaxID=2956889 RepID=UPI003335E28F